MKTAMYIILSIIMIVCIMLDVNLTISNYNNGYTGIMVLSIFAGLLCTFSLGTYISGLIKLYRKNKQNNC